MFGKIGAWFKSFFRNVAEDPVSSIKGVISLAAGGAACYGMATGKVPVSIGAPVASHLVTSGIYALGTDNTTKKVDPAAQHAADLVQTAANMAPSALTIADHYNAIKEAAGQAQATMAAIAEASNALATVAVPSPPPAPVQEEAPAAEEEPAPEAPAAPAPAAVPAELVDALKAVTDRLSSIAPAPSGVAVAQGVAPVQNP